MASKVVETWQARELAGTLSHEDAQKAALDQLRDIRFGSAKDYFFVQRYDGVTLLNPNRELEGKNRLDVKDSTGNPYLRAQIEAAKTGGGLVFYRFPRPNSTTPLPKLSYALGFAPWQWAICTGIYIDDIDDAFNAMAIRFGGFGLIAVVVLLGVSLTIGRAVAIPLRRLTGTLGRLSGGDLDIEVPYTEMHNEIGAVANAVGAFRGALRRDSELAKTRTLDANERELKHARITSLTRQFDTEMDEITTSLASASTQMRSNAQHLSQNAEIVQDRAASVHKAADAAASNVDAVSASVKVMAVCVSEIGSAMSETSRISREAVTGANAARETMRELVEAATKIGTIVGIVKGIASQTNLLALNAAVEAARAGEEGRGFAVVAGEVRSLAQRSSAAAKEIKGLIHTSVSRVSDGSTFAHEAGATMDEVVRAVKRVTDIMGEISAASAEQSSGIEEINHAVTQMDAGTQQNAALVEQAAAAAQSLDDQAHALKQLVGKFQLK